jgi:hypothetical protein
MIQTDVLEMSKRIAKIPLGPVGRDSYTYLADLRNQWENSYSSSKITELIGSQSMPKSSLPDVEKWLGKFSGSEQDFSKKCQSLYQDLVRQLTTLETPDNSNYDIAETLLDRRILSDFIKPPCKILDIGPGAGRHMANAFLSSEYRNSIYVGIESIGLPYSLQNAVASYVWTQDKKVKFYEYIDYEFGRKNFPSIEAISPNSIVHLPLWKMDLIPKNYFDVILCNYILDEVPGDDFDRITNIIGNCLAPEGIVYCRGSQHRSMIKNMYLYGYGTYHGIDITKSILSKGMKTAMCENIAAELTRVFVRENSKTHNRKAGKYADFKEDIPLIQEMQNDYIAANMKELAKSDKTVLVWGDVGYSHYLKYIAPYKDDVDIIGLTSGNIALRPPAAPPAASGSPQAAQAEVKVQSNSGIIKDSIKHAITHVTPGNILGLTGAAVSMLKKKKTTDIREHSPNDFPSMAPDVVIIASMRDYSILRQIHEMSSPGEFELVRKFNYPVAFAYRTPPSNGPVTLK